METLKPAINPEDILSSWHREILSPNAVKLYEACWHRMRIKGRTELWMDDEEASTRARVLIQHIPAARTELVNLGLLECRQGLRQWRFAYIEQTEPNEANSEQHTFEEEPTQ
jgi:hypothetical protein